jgi:hypothetical protein
LPKVVSVIALTIVLGALSAAQTSNPASVVRRVRMIHEQGSPAVEILASGPLFPKITTLKSPPRIVIDLPNARLGPLAKRDALPEENVVGIHFEAAVTKPPSVQITLELAAANSYEWGETNNRLTIRLKPEVKPEDEAKARKAVPPSPPQVQAPAAQALTLGGEPAVVPVTSGSGGVALAGNRIAAGSAITAGSDSAILRLARGGEVRVCPGTTVSVTPSPNKHDLMLGMSTGALEAHYTLDASADTVLTPDFRILFAGPGEFHYAVSVDTHGNTCVRGLAGNSSSAIVSELMGDRIYQVKPSEQVVFRAGQIDHVDADVPLECGCPPPVPVLRAENSVTAGAGSDLPATARLGDEATASSVNAAGGSSASASPAGSNLSNVPATAAVPASQPNDVHVQVDAPIVFSAKDRAGARPSAVQAARELPVQDAAARPAHVDAVVQLAPQQEKPPSAGQRFLRRIKGFFGYMTH